MPLARISIQVTPELEKVLRRFMRSRRIKTKSEAIRIALLEGADNAVKKTTRCDFGDWIGLALRHPENPNPRFRSHDDLWK